MATPLSQYVEDAGIAAFEAWATPQIEAAPWISRNAIKEYFASHKEMLIEAVGPAIIEAYEAERAAEVPGTEPPAAAG